MLNYLCIIQARLGSSRLPNKVLETVDGVPMVKRVWNAATLSKADKVVVAWPERFPDLDQNNVLERFRRVSREFPSRHIIRLTADCPLLMPTHINEAIEAFHRSGKPYYCNDNDGFDVQVSTRDYLFDDVTTHKEHVYQQVPITGGFSVNTKNELEIVRERAKSLPKLKVSRHITNGVEKSIFYIRGSGKRLS